MKQRILIGDYMYNLIPKVPKKVWQQFEKKYEVVHHPHKKLLTKKQILSYAKDCVGIAAATESTSVITDVPV